MISNKLVVAVLWEHSPQEGDHYESRFVFKKEIGASVL